MSRRVLFSFESNNVEIDGRRVFRRGEPIRLSWLALLAIRLLSKPQAASVTLDEVARLPIFKGTPKRTVGNYIARYLKSPELQRSDLVSASRLHAGPYQLAADPLNIAFDIPLAEVHRRLQIRQGIPRVGSRENLRRFVVAYVRGQYLLFEGRLRRTRSTGSLESAYAVLLGLWDKSGGFSSSLRLLAGLGSVDVLFKLGQYQTARETLGTIARLASVTPVFALRARYHLARAWLEQRSSTSKESDRVVQNALKTAKHYSDLSNDVSSAALLSYRRGLYLTKKGRTMAAVDEFAHAAEQYLIVGNYQGVQTACGELGSVIHRAGKDHYEEARRWLLSGILIARRAHIGRDDSYSEMILGKIYTQCGWKSRSQRLLRRAERVATRANNRVNLADVKMVWAFWHARFGSEAELIQTLAAALHEFRSLPEFDVEQKEHYIKTHFPDVWPQVETLLRALTVNNGLSPIRS